MLNYMYKYIWLGMGSLLLVHMLEASHITSNFDLDTLPVYHKAHSGRWTSLIRCLLKFIANYAGFGHWPQQRGMAWNFKHIFVISISSIFFEIAPRWIAQEHSNDNITLVQIMAWGHQALCHCATPSWPISMRQYGITDIEESSPNDVVTSIWQNTINNQSQRS